MASRKGNWRKDALTLENGAVVEALFPEIVSASRSTDIPAFYADWFFHCLEKGYSVWTNPFNGAKSYVAYRDTRFIVFWSKNPYPLLRHLSRLQENSIGTYLQFTLNDYESDALEKNVPPLAKRIETFRALSSALGKDGVVWRFDPLLLTDRLDVDSLLARVERIGDQLAGYTEKLLFSFADIAGYRKVRRNLEVAGVPYREWTNSQMVDFASKLVEMNKRNGWNFRLATCGEAVDFECVEHNRCIDDSLIVRRAYRDKALMDFLKVKILPLPTPNLFGEVAPIPANAILLDNGQYAVCGDNRDKGQREFCGCIKAKDIGQYNTCIHKCEYCYANDNKAIAVRNYEEHKRNPFGETITGL